MFELTLYSFESQDGRPIGESTRDLKAAYAFAQLLQCKLIINHFEVVDTSVLADYTQREFVHDSVTQHRRAACQPGGQER